MQNKKCLERCLELIRDKRYRELSAILAEQNPVDLADLLEGLPQEQGALAFRTLPKEQAAEVFSNLPPDTQQMIVVSLPDRELAGILEELAMDDTVDLLGGAARRRGQAGAEKRPARDPQAHQPVPQISGAVGGQHHDRGIHRPERDHDRGPRPSAGSAAWGETANPSTPAMSPTAARVLDGVVTLRELLLAPDNAPVRTLMEPNVITVRTHPTTRNWPSGP